MRIQIPTREGAIVRVKRTFQDMPGYVQQQSTYSKRLSGDSTSTVWMPIGEY